MKYTFFKIKYDLILFVIGLALVCYPIFSNYIEHKDQLSQISTYDDYTKNLSDEEKTAMLETAEKWNNDLFLKQNGLTSQSELNYNQILNIGNQIIGTIEIPNIDVNMPIYHGTDDDVLSVGAGHLPDSSLPIGGKNTHTVLTGHRGLPSSKLFTRLDELKKGDLFYIKVLDKTLAYKIDTIETVLPENAHYEIESGKDLATLVTCTPYGINTHRLMLTGHRVPYKEEEKNQIKEYLPSLREIIFYIIPLFFISSGLILYYKERRKS